MKFEKTRVMSTYLYAFMIGQYYHVDTELIIEGKDEPLPFSIYTRQSLKDYIQVEL